MRPEGEGMCWCLDRTVLLLSPIVAEHRNWKYDILYTLPQSDCHTTPTPSHWKIKRLHRPTTGNLISDKVAHELQLRRSYEHDRAFN